MEARQQLDAGIQAIIDAYAQMGQELTEEPSYPCLVVKMKYREEPVIFE